MDRNRKIIVIMAGLLLVGSLAFLYFGNAMDGEKIFVSEGCKECHMIRGEGGVICPDLTNVVLRRSDEWIYDQIKNSRKHNPESRMPVFDHLKRREIKAIINYLEKSRNIKISNN